MQKNEQGLRLLWHAIKFTNILIVKVSEGEERDKGSQRILEEIRAEKLPDFRKSTNLCIQETQ